MSFKVPTHYIDEEYGLEHQMLFQTPLFTASLQEFDNRKLEKDIYELKSIDSGVNRSNKNGYHSESYEIVRDFSKIHGTNGDIFHPFIKELETVISKLPFTPQITEIKTVNIWANVSPKGGLNQQHNHPCCDLAGVYYVKIPEGDCGLLNIFDPREALVFGNQFITQTYTGGESTIRYPIEGQMWLFPAALKHSVGTNNTEEDRISISFNLSF